MSFCLIPQSVDRFKQALTDGTLNPEQMSTMTSAERRGLIAGIVGENDATAVNALFESKLLLKNQQTGMINWAKKVLGVSPQVKRDLISRIEKMDKILSPEDQGMFLKDLAEYKLGFGVSSDEAKTITDMTKKMVDLRGKADPETFKFASESERLDYGTSLATLQDYVGSLKIQKPTLKQWLTNPMHLINAITGSTKSAVASLDNSFFGRQGIKMLYTNPDIWAKSFVKSWKDIGRQLFAKGKWYAGGDDATMLAIKADVYSRPNALNGKYKAGDYAIGILSEEAYPSSLPEKIPIFGRLFKASEVAYNGAALRMRGDYGDRVIAAAERGGINTLNPIEAKPLGHLVNSLTGRGSIGKLDVVGQELNAGFFSIKFLKSNFDVLTAHLFDRGASSFVKKQAAGNLVKMIGVTTAILGTAELLHPGSVEWDPRSTRFGKIKIGNTTFDVTGGIASLATLISRTMVPTKGPEGWGLYTKSSTTGQLTKLNSKKYGKQTALDIIESFWEGKLSPAVGIVRDVWKGEDYQGNVVSPISLLRGATTPIIIQNFEEMKNDPNAADLLASMILDGLGISTGTYGGSQKQLQKLLNTNNIPKEVVMEFDRLAGTGNKPSMSDPEGLANIKDFKTQVSSDIYNQFLSELKSTLPGVYQNTMMNTSYLGSSDKDKASALDHFRSETIKALLDKYRYQKTKTNETLPWYSTPTKKKSTPWSK